MRIAVTYENGEVFQHFGRTQQFKIYEVERGVVHTAEVVGTNGSGHGALQVEVLICDGQGCHELFWLQAAAKGSLGVSRPFGRPRIPS